MIKKFGILTVIFLFAGNAAAQLRINFTAEQDGLRINGEGSFVGCLPDHMRRDCAHSCSGWNDGQAFNIEGICNSPSDPWACMCNVEIKNIEPIEEVFERPDQCVPMPGECATSCPTGKARAVMRNPQYCGCDQSINPGLCMEDPVKFLPWACYCAN